MADKRAYELLIEMLECDITRVKEEMSSALSMAAVEQTRLAEAVSRYKSQRECNALLLDALTETLEDVKKKIECCAEVSTAPRLSDDCK